MVSLLCTSLAGGIETFPSYLQHKCKTHTELVAFRPLHSSFKHAFTGLMSWVAMILQEGLAKSKHLCGSTDLFLKRITSVEMEEIDIIMQVNLKDFFMTCSAEYFTHHASLPVPTRFRTVFGSVLMLLLSKSWLRRQSS